MTGQNTTRHKTTQYIYATENNRGKFGPPAWNWEGLKKGDVTLPRVLQTSGYKTIHVGKAHFGPKGSDGENPLNLGFDVNIAGNHWGHPNSYYGEDHYGNHPKYKGEDGKQKLHNNIIGLEKYYGTNTFLTEALTLEANSEISKAVAEKKPFFLYMAHYAVHAPFMSDPRFAAHYKNSDKSKQAQAYATLVEGMDQSLGDILDQLNELGVAENTLVIFLGDNGSDAPLGAQFEHTSSAPLRGNKGTHYQGGVRVPFIAAWAKPDTHNAFQKKLPIPHGIIQGQMGTVMDLFPTLVTLTGSHVRKTHIIDGFNLATQIKGHQNPNRSETFLLHFPHNHRSNYFTSYCADGWKLIYHYHPKTPKSPQYELFHLKDDPFENHDLSRQSPEKLKSMMRAMSQQLIKEGALYPIDADENELKPIIP